MKVSSIDTLRIEEFPNLLLVEVKTDSGLIGLGETFYGPASAEAHIHEIIAPYLLGITSKKFNRLYWFYRSICRKKRFFSYRYSFMGFMGTRNLSTNL